MVKKTTLGSTNPMTTTMIASSSSGIAECVDTSEANRQRLEKWSENSKHQNISFWIPPSVIATTDQCIAEVGKALARFDEEKKSKTATPVEEKPENNL